MNVIYGSCYEAFPGKNHDQFVTPDSVAGEIDPIFAVFDGAGNVFASHIAAHALRAMLIDRDYLGAELGLDKIHEEVLGLFNGGRLTTASVLRLSYSEHGGNRANFSHAGDSRIYRYIPDRDDLSLLTRDENGIYEVDGRKFNDTRNFIGSPNHQLTCFGGIMLRQACSFALVTDGITDSHKKGAVKYGEIKEILRSDSSPKKQAVDLVKASKIKDDKTAIVVKVTI